MHEPALAFMLSLILSFPVYLMSSAGGVGEDFEIDGHVIVCAKLLSCVQLFATPWTVAHQAPLSVGFSRQEWGCHFLLQGIFLTQGLNLGLLHCRQILYHLSHQGKKGPYQVK